jgi:hypothetical protein
MHLLIKSNGEPGLAAHIPDMNGDPLCNIKIKRADWHVCDRSPNRLVVCYHCRRVKPDTCIAWLDRNTIVNE